MKNLLALLIALFFFTACKKKDDTIYLSQDIKTKFGFKPGSYWIYRDSISGRVDSCWIDFNNLFITDDYEEPPNTEVLNILFKQKAIAPIDTKICKWSLVFEGLNLMGYSSDEILDVHPQILDCIYPISSGYNGQTFQSKESQISALESYSLGTNTFSKVAQIVYLDNMMYINDSVGYIKKRLKFSDPKYNYTTHTYDTIKVNEVWELQRWNVIK